MAELLTTAQLNAESHLLLEESLLRLPSELSRKNFKSVQRIYEHERVIIKKQLKEAAEAANVTHVDQTDDNFAEILEKKTRASLHSLDSMIARIQNLKRKMEATQEEEKIIEQQTRKRIQHLQDLYEIPSLADVKYDDWSRVRLDRLLVDYLLRKGYTESAKELAKEREIVDLVDLDVFVHCHKIEDGLRRGGTAECLAWCTDHKPMMKKTSNHLEFELRLQQYIELCRERRLLDARQHAQKHFVQYKDAHILEIRHAAGLLAFSPDTQAEPYKTMYSLFRWASLADLFVKTHHDLYSLPHLPLLHVALSAGLSALKTPSCHSAYAPSSSNARSITTSICPICSTELNELARNLPYAHHTKSYVENDPIVLPNGRIYGRDRLMAMSVQVGLEGGKVKDPTTGEVFGEEEIRKVYIS